MEYSEGTYTVTLRPPSKSQQMLMNVGEIVKIKSTKRWVGRVTHASGNENIFQAQLKMIYRPSPKSLLRKGSYFSKNQREIYIK